MKNFQNRITDLTGEQMSLIGECLPDFKIKNCRVLNRGANSTAVLVNGHYVFRFPLGQENSDDYVREKKILDIIGPHIKSTAIPRIEIHEKNGSMFTLHRIIEGVEYMAISDGSNSLLRRNLAKDLAKFFWELHSIDPSLVDFIPLEQFSASYFQLDGAAHTLKEILIDEYQNDLEKRIDYLNDYKNFDPGDNVLCHDDLHEENIIVNGNRLSGIIDFASVKKRKRDTDFSNLLEYDYQLAIGTIEEYEKLTGKVIDLEYIYNLQKIRCYGLLLWFIRQNDRKYAELFKKFVGNLNRIAPLLAQRDIRV